MCPRCRKSHSNEITFYLKPQNIRLVAHCCKVCGFIFAEDEVMLKAIRKHLKWVTQTNARDTLDICPPKS